MGDISISLRSVPLPLALTSRIGRQLDTIVSEVMGRRQNVVCDELT
jgi:hypothetical protein